MPKKKLPAKASPLEGVSFTPVLTAMLKPSAQMIGIELRDYLKEKIDGWKTKRRNENLKAHIEAVKKKLSSESDQFASQPEPTLEQAELFSEWVETVQDIDPAHREISELWQNLLARAASGEAVFAEVVAALKTLTPREASLLLTLEHRVPSMPFVTAQIPSEERFLAMSLERKHLVERDYAFAYMFLATTVSGLALFYSFAKLHALPLLPASLSAAVIAISAIVAVLGLRFRTGLARWRPTWLGQQIASYARES